MKSSCAVPTGQASDNPNGAGAGSVGAVGSDSRLGRRVVMVAVATCLLVMSVVHASLPASPFDLFPAEGKRVLLSLTPQGWSFFTRSPRIPSAVVYRYEQNGWRDITTG